MSLEKKLLEKGKSLGKTARNPKNFVPEVLSSIGAYSSVYLGAEFSDYFNFSSEGAAGFIPACKVFGSICGKLGGFELTHSDLKKEDRDEFKEQVKQIKKILPTYHLLNSVVTAGVYLAIEETFDYKITDDALTTTIVSYAIDTCLFPVRFYFEKKAGIIK